MLLDIDHVQIAAPAGCESAARRFFGELLGLPEIEKPQELRGRGGCWFRVGPRQLHIGVEDPFQAARKAHPAFAVDDVDALFHRLHDANVDCRWDMSVARLKRFFAFDPWGNRLEFTQPTG